MPVVVRNCKSVVIINNNNNERKELKKREKDKVAGTTVGLLSHPFALVAISCVHFVGLPSRRFVLTAM